MTLKPLKIGKYEIKYPIFQGGMGVGISWSSLAGNVSKEGCLGIISSVGTGYYTSDSEIKKNINGRPVNTPNFYSKYALNKIFSDARKICGDAPLGVNALYAINDYGRVVRDACEVGANIIVTGAGLPTNMPEFTVGYDDVALVPIVSSAKALKIICKRWKSRYNRLPDAVVLEGPLSGGHQGFTYEQCNNPEYELENLIEPVVKEASLWGNIPVIAAGGIWDHNDIIKMIDLGASGVQMATRFIATHECDAHDNFKNVILNSKKEDILLFKSPVGYPARGIKTNLMSLIEHKSAPKIQCVSNCVSPCQRGIGAKKVGYCIADRLSDAYNGKVESGLFFSGANGYRTDKLIHVKELIKKLVEGE